MVFMIILLVVAIVATVLLDLYTRKEYSEASYIGAILMGVTAGIIAIALPYNCVIAKVNKTLIQSQLENPSQYTYTQLAEHNEMVTKLRVWQGTIFSFYNDIDLSNIDIDSVGQKVIVCN